MEETMTERAHVERLFALTGRKREIAVALEAVNAELRETEDALIKALTAQDKLATATYEELGYATLGKPAVRASYSKEEEERVFAALQEVGRGDLIRREVNPRSLSSFVAERLEAGEPVPELIKYYLQPRLYVFRTDGKRY